MSMTDFFKSENSTDRDILSQVWRVILLAFDQGRMRIRGYVFFFFFFTLFIYLVLFIENTTVKPQIPKSIKKESYQAMSVSKEKQPANDQTN